MAYLVNYIVIDMTYLFCFGLDHFVSALTLTSCLLSSTKADYYCHMTHHLIILDKLLSSYAILCFGSEMSILCISHFQFFSYCKICNMF
jgi:hypothetical protein